VALIRVCVGCIVILRKVFVVELASGVALQYRSEHAHAVFEASDASTKVRKLLNQI
jgi:hypothetical protein